MRLFFSILATLGLGVSSSLFASGMTLHIWMAEKAANEYVHIPELRAFLQEQSAAYKNGSIFPDSGYAAGHAFGEYSHWDHFLNSYYAVIDERCPDLSSGACRKAFAHMLGSLAHSIGDVNFDRHFVTAEAHHDHGGDIGTAQSYTDPGCDFLAILEHKRGFKIPDLNLPTAELLAAFDRGGQVSVTAEDMNKGAAIQKLALVGEPLGSPFTYLYYKAKMPWGSKNYVHARGGVNDTARRIAHAWELVWVRYHRGESPEGLFDSVGGWPYVDFYIADELLENF
ncbi:zinc dependent phospholipase C family protein [Oligoflexus tunisiensis]|uniref:zinc dependent phospholipase C family protein n=1 Tax=Oligoflexus tunisiensis TaxID=708132 RepID=UPI00159F02E0|nr:zinc dependent phospholipase C family protein [Oligoflexus tunisiensis]